MTGGGQEQRGVAGHQEELLTELQAVSAEVCIDADSGSHHIMQFQDMVVTQKIKF